MWGLFLSGAAMRAIAILALVGLCSDGAMAQSTPNVLVAALGPTDMVRVSVPATAEATPPGLLLSGKASLTRLTKYFDTFLGCCENGLSASSPISNFRIASAVSIRLASAQLNKNSNAIAAVLRTSFDVLANFIVAYKSLRKKLPVSAKSLIQKYAKHSHTAVVGAASTYNPYLENGSHETETASGEPYDPNAWTAAIRVDLREQFGGVRYGKNYRPTFALVEGDEKCLIIMINDVGPLEPGRVIDLNERSMDYFDATKQIGLINDVKVTLLPGDDWTPGPIGSKRQLSLATSQ